MDVIIVLISSVVGYLIGSISSGRIIAGIVAPQADISTIRQDVPDSDEVFESDSISATSVRLNVGTKYGVLTAILDMVKVAIPVLALMLLFPDQPYFLFAAAAGHVGHNWPLYHRFQGGRGESPIYGALLVIDPLGVVVMNVVGMAFGMIIGNLLIFRWTGLVLMIPWFWLRTAGWYHVSYMIFVNAIYWISMMPELGQYFEYQKKGINPSQEDLADFLGMGKSLGRVMDRFSLTALFSKHDHK
jgi:glycerol-3-phosphate acyltransferase PlsY